MGTALAFCGVVSSTALADPSPVTVTGVPPQVVPTIQETGAPTFTTPDGGSSFLGDQGGSSSGGGTTGYGGTGSTTGGGAALDQLMSTSYGSLAVNNAQSVGVSGDALADIGLVESNFQNVGTANGSSSATGVWQITQGTWDDYVSKYDLPYTDADRSNVADQSVVASYIIKDYASSVTAETQQPATVVQTYGAYVYGPSAGANMAAASPDTPMSAFVSSTALANNNMTGWTVGQFYSTMGNKIGSTASSNALT